MTRRSAARLGCLVALIAARAAAGQEPVVVGSELEDYLHLLELDGRITKSPLIYRSLSTWSSTAPSMRVSDTGRRPPRWRSASSQIPHHLWADRYALGVATGETGSLTATVIRPEVTVIHNSDYPRSVNDGAVWAGKGTTASLSGGAQLRWGPVTGTFYPTVYFSQNSDFATEPVPFGDRSQFAYPWHRGIDFPQRFGPDGDATFDWGQSGIRLDLGAFTAGLSTENLWWGPAFRNPIIMGNTAPGFLHVDIGTGHPVSIGIGQLEVRAVWGSLAESDYFDSNPDNNHRYLTGITVGYQPSFLPGLTIGGTRVLYQTWPADGLGFDEIFDFTGELFSAGAGDTLPSGTPVNDLTDQLLSAVARWVFPESGFEAYIEWARNDFNAEFRDLLGEPDHSRGYTIGIQKTLPSGTGVLRLRSEFTSLGRSITSLGRASPPFYVHSVVRQGYTQRGQLLGAGIGPGSNSQILTVDRYTSRGRWGFLLQRVRFDDDAFFRDLRTVPDRTFRNHDVELTAGVSALRFFNNFDIAGSLELSRRLNWYFQYKNDVTNLSAKLTVRWGRKTGPRQRR